MSDKPKVLPPGSNPCFFVVGCPRSGTTLLRRLLDAHPRLCVPKAETHWIPKFYSRGDGLDMDGNATPAFVDVLMAYPRFRKFRADRQTLLSFFDGRPCMDYAEFVRRLFDWYGEQRGKPLIGDKTPGYARYIPLLHKLFPQARFIHLLRDGRDTALSLLSWDRLHKTAGRLATFDEDPVTTTALFWEWLVRLGRETGSHLPQGLYMEVSYERLVDDTEPACREICEFLGIAFEPEMLEYHRGRQKPGRGLSAKKAWLPPTGKLRDWRHQMSGQELLLFEAACASLLTELGYEVRNRDVDPAVIAHALRLRQAFERRPVPEAWLA